MKRSLFSLVLLIATISAGTLSAQNFIQTSDGKCYWTEDTLGNAGEVKINSGMKIQRVAVADIVLVENMEYGAEVLHPEKLRPVEPVAFVGGVTSFCAAGKKVYIPIASERVEQRWGARRLSELLLIDKHWQVVGSAEQADFLLEYVFDNKGRDKAYLRLKDRMGKQILQSRTTGAHDWVPKDAGTESANKLYDKYLKNGFYADDFDGWSTTNSAFADKLFVNIGVGPFLAEIPGSEYTIGYDVNACMTYRPVKGVAFGLGVDFRRGGLEDYLNNEEHIDPHITSLSPFFHLTFYINHWNPTYFKFTTGPFVSLKDYVYIMGYPNPSATVYTYRYGSYFFNIAYGRQWKNIAFEGYVGINDIDQYKNSIFYQSSICVTAGLQLSYKIPIINPKKTVAGE